MHPLALSEIPKHLRGHSGQAAFHPVPEKQRGQGPLRCFEVLSCFQSLCLPRMDGVVPKTAKDTEETSALLSYYMSINETSSIIFQFADTLKRLDVNILVLPNIQHTYTCTHTNTHWLADANWWLAQESTTFSCSCPHSTDRWCTMSAFFSSLGNAEQTMGFPFDCFKESQLTTADLPSLSVSDPKRSRSLLLNGVFC